MKTYETVIIGGGPAGLMATIYAVRRGLDTLLVSKDIGGQLRWCSDISNWLGVDSCSGPDLIARFEHQLQSLEGKKGMDFEMRLGSNVASCHQVSKGFELVFEDGQRVQSQTLIITSGKKPRMLGVPGESRAQEGNGLSFSVTSDAPLYTGKKVVIIGGGNSAMDVALQLTNYTDDITLMTDIDSLMGEQVLIDKIRDHRSTHLITNVAVQEILLDADHKVCGVRYRQSEGEDQVIECEGIFESIGFCSDTTFLDGLVDTTQRGEIITNDKCETSMSGIFAGGDCTVSPYKQAIIAAGQGAVCALSAHHYLQQK